MRVALPADSVTLTAATFGACAVSEPPQPLTARPAITSVTAPSVATDARGEMRDEYLRAFMRPFLANDDFDGG